MSTTNLSIDSLSQLDGLNMATWVIFESRGKVMEHENADAAVAIQPTQDMEMVAQKGMQPKPD